MSFGRRLPTKERTAATIARPENFAPSERRPVDLGPLEKRQPKPNALGELTFEETALYLNITTRALQQRIKEGRPHPPFKVRFGRRYFPIEVLKNWQDSDHNVAA